MVWEEMRIVLEMALPSRYVCWLLMNHNVLLFLRKLLTTISYLSQSNLPYPQGEDNTKTIKTLGAGPLLPVPEACTQDAVEVCEA